MEARIRRFQATLQEALVDAVRGGISRDLEAAGVDGDRAYALMTAVDELCCNVLEHAGASWVEMEVRPGGESLQVLLRDDGSPFDPTGGPRREGGFALEKVEDRKLGLYMIARLAERFEYRRLGGGVNECCIEIKRQADPTQRGA